MEIHSEPSSSECFLNPFAMLSRFFSICLLLEPSCAAYRSLNIFLWGCVLNLKQPSFPSNVFGKIPTHSSGLAFFTPPSGKPSPARSDRMRSLFFHTCRADSTFLSHNTLLIELLLVLPLIAKHLLNSKHWTKSYMSLCTLGYLILTIAQWVMSF